MERKAAAAEQVVGRAVVTALRGAVRADFGVKSTEAVEAGLGVGPVLLPPCRRQGVLPRTVGARQGRLARVRAPQRSTRLGLPRGLPLRIGAVAGGVVGDMRAFHRMFLLLFCARMRRTRPPASGWRAGYEAGIDPGRSCRRKNDAIPCHTWCWEAHAKKSLLIMQKIVADLLAE